MGEVPDEFRAQPIEICITARHLPRLACGLGSRYTTRLLIKGPARDQFVLVPSKAVDSDHHTAQDIKAWLPPLKMQNSQYIARKTLLRAELYSGRTCVHTVQKTLAALVWREHEPSDTDCISSSCSGALPTSNFVQKRRGTSSSAKPELSLRVVRFDRFAHMPRAPLVEVRVSVSSLLRTSVAGSKKLTYTISRLSRRNDWTFVYRSEPVGSLCKASRNNFTAAELTYDFLFRGQDDKPLRFALHVADNRTGIRMQCYSIVTLGDLMRMTSDGRSYCFVHKTDDAVVNAGLKLQSLQSVGDVTSIFFVFKHIRQCKHQTGESSGFLLHRDDDGRVNHNRQPSSDLLSSSLQTGSHALNGGSTNRATKPKISRSVSKGVLKHSLLRRHNTPGSSLDEPGLKLIRLHRWEGADFSID